MSKESVGDVFYKAVIKSLREANFDSTDGKLVATKANNARVARAVIGGFGAIGDFAGMLALPALCDFSEIEEE